MIRDRWYNVQIVIAIACLAAVFVGISLDAVGLGIGNVIRYGAVWVAGINTVIAFVRWVLLRRSFGS